METNKIKEIVKKYDLTKDDFWNLTGNVWIIKHDACQKIAKIEHIVFENPTIVEHSREHCILMGTAGKSIEKNRYISEWTFGEADKKTNCKNQYIFAMAEKRLKDRLTLKLINAYEHGIYSDTESDDFKKPKSNFEDNGATGPQQSMVHSLLNHTAFTVGQGAKFKDDIKDSIIAIFESKSDTSELISDLKSLKQSYINAQKSGKVV